MHDAAVVGGTESRAQLQYDARCRRSVERSPLVDEVSQRRAIEKLHVDERPAIVEEVEVDDVDDVWMADEVDGAGFVEEALDDLRPVRVLGVQ